MVELTELVTLPGWPKGTRLIVRREPLHPGVQQSLFPSLEYRYWGFYTDQDGDPVELDRIMRAHAHVEEHISRLKDSGLLRFPFTSSEANATGWPSRWPPTSCAGSSSCASTGTGGRRGPRHFAGACSMCRVDWSRCPSVTVRISTAGPARRPSSVAYGKIQALC